LVDVDKFFHVTTSMPVTHRLCSDIAVALGGDFRVL
jgi:hypothetical protein